MTARRDGEQFAVLGGLGGLGEEFPVQRHPGSDAVGATEIGEQQQARLLSVAQRVAEPLLGSAAQAKPQRTGG